MFASRMVKLVQGHLIPLSVRRTNNSKDYKGQLLNKALPESTFVHVAVEVTEEESKQSYEDLDRDAITARYFDVANYGVRVWD